MEQKNTIVKCKAHPDCLFNHNGICDNYVINIGADGKCESYVETATDEEIKKIAIYKPGSKEPLLVLDELQRGLKSPAAETNQWKARYDCYTCLHNTHGECEFKARPIITSQGRCCRYEV